MNVKKQIQEYIVGQSQPKKSDLQELHRIILKTRPTCNLWFLDGKNAEGKIVSNPSIGYGLQTLKQAGGKFKEFYQVGISANTTGISVYILGMSDKKYLSKTYGNKIGKARVTGYCVKFRALKDINIEVLEAAIRDGFKAPSEK